MKRALLWLAAAGLSAWGAAGPGNPALVQNQVVYLLPMSSGFEHYLATELTRQHAVTVTTDPKKATAVLTDRLGEPLELKLKEYYDPPPVETKSKDKDKDDSKGALKTNSIPPRVSSFGGGRGTVYLVDTRNRQVLWSIYARPKNTTPHELHHTAEKVTQRLLQDAAVRKSQ